MSIQESVTRALKRLTFKGSTLKGPVFLQALYEGLAVEFDRLNNFKEKVRKSTVPNPNMDPDTIDDYYDKYGIESITTDTMDEQIQKIIARASENGSGGPDWLEGIIQASGFDLYVIVNEPDSESSFPQYGDFQYGDVQYGGLISYTDPRNIDGELIASSPVSSIGGLYLQYGDYQYGDVQFGTIIPGTTYPRPRDFTIPSDPDRWGYVFFLSPFPDRLAGSSELAQYTDEEMRFLTRLILQSKFTRNWCILQAEAV